MSKCSRLCCVLLMSVGLPLPAQSFVDVNVPSGFPMVTVPFFSDATSVCGVVDGPAGAAHCLTGLPGTTPSYTILPVPSVGPWTKLSENVAVLTQPNGTIGIIRGLPGNPEVLSTSVLGNPEDAVLVNPWTIAWPRAGGFTVVRFSQGAVASTFIATPQALSLTTELGAGASSWDTVFSLGQGADGIAGTSDDSLVRVDGLDSMGFSSLSTSVVPLALSFTPTTLSMAKSGAAVVWRRTAVTTVEGAVVQVGPLSVATVPLSISLPASWPGVPPSGTIRASSRGEDGMWFRIGDPEGVAQALYSGLSGTPTLVQVWNDNQAVAYNFSWVLSDRLIAYTNSAAQWSFSYVRYLSPLAGGYTTVEPDGWIDFNTVIPNERTIALFTIGSYPIGTPGIKLVIITDTDTTAFTIPGGFWATGSSYYQRNFFSMGQGAVGGFYRIGSGPFRLRICSFPVASPHEARGKRFAPAATQLSLSTALPTTNQPLTIQIAAPGASGPIWLGVATEKVSRGPLALAPGDALIHLDLANLAALLPLPASGAGGASFTVSAGVPPVLIGQPLYLQALASINGNAEASDLALVIYHQ